MASGPWPGLGVKACGTLIELGHPSRLITYSKVTYELLRGQNQAGRVCSLGTQGSTHVVL